MNRNILPNTYIPVVPPRHTILSLSRLSKHSLTSLIDAWAQNPRTQPKQHQSTPDASKKAIIEHIVHRLYPSGLSLLQISQIDSQAVVDRPSSFSWVSSTVQDADKRPVAISMSPDVFLRNLIKELSALYMTYAYVCTHPHMPLHLVRIQAFDLSLDTATRKGKKRPHISSRRPYFVAIPHNSPYIIHTPGRDMFAQLVLQAVGRSLPQNPNNLLHLAEHTSRPQSSLYSMHIRHGNSRFRRSMGVWTPYADGSAEEGPLGTKQERYEQEPSEKSDDVNLSESAAHVRFKGTASGKLKSRALFEGDKTGTVPGVYESIAPVQYAEFTIRDEINGEEAGIKLKLAGNDVFGGLHELAAEGEVIDPWKVPSFLTGEDDA